MISDFVSVTAICRKTSPRHELSGNAPAVGQYDRSMRLRKSDVVLTMMATALLSCSSAPPKQEAAKEPAKPAEPVGGRYAFHQTYITARTWATDLQILRVRNIHIGNAPTAPGKSAVWEITFVSPSKQRARAYTYSVIEQEPIHEGVFAGLEQSFSGSQGQATPFPIAALKVDTPAAWETAVEHSKEYMAKTTEKTITYLLEKTPRHPDPSWRVIWGTSPATSNYSIYVDASTGAYLERMR